MTIQPEINAFENPNDPKWAQKVLLAIARFMVRPPGVARVTFNSGTAVATIQVTNRVGLDAIGSWLVLGWGTDATGVPFTLTPAAPSAGQLLDTLPSSTSYLWLTDTRGKVVFNVGGVISTGRRINAIVLGEADYYLAP